MGNDCSGYWLPWACDNGAFSGLDAPAFLRCLADFRKKGARPDWIACPDKVGDHVETLRLWHCWSPMIREIGYTPAFVLQDGCRPDDVPDCDVVFVGGSTEYKLGPDAAACVLQAKAAGKIAHMGRVNSQKRIAYADSLGCDSVDGRQWSSFGDTYLPGIIRWFEQRAQQHILF